MKKTILTILTIICIFLPVLGSVNRLIFEISVILWPIAVLITIILNIRWKTKIKIGKYEKIEESIKKRKEKEEESG